MNMSEKFKKIDSFFENLEVEEFEKIVEEAGINEIKASSNENMELLLSSTYTTKPVIDIKYTNKDYQFIEKENSYDLYFDYYAKAV